MTFAYPWILALGAVAAAAPVIVHWLTRPRPVRMPLSTLRFVREAIRQRRSAHRLRDLLILACRTLAILLLAAAFAGPRWGEPSLLDDETGDAVRVVLLDVSQSMAAADGNVQALDRARSAADRYLQYRPGLRTNLILAGAEPRAVFDNPSTNFEALRDELAQAAALPQRANVPRALELASRLLAPVSESDRRRRELVIVSDFQRSGWANARFDALPEGVKIQMESVAPSVPPANLAVNRAICRPLGANQDRLHLEVAVGNYSPAARTVEVDVELGGAAYRLSAVCAPWDETVVTQELPAPSEGWQWGTVRLVDVDDALQADNARPLVVQLRGRPQYALVTEQPPDLRPSSSHILSCALAPELERNPTERRVQWVEPSRLDNQSLADARLIAINRCGKLSAEAIDALARQITRGRPVIYVASEAIDATNLDRLVKAAQLKLPVRFAPPPAGAFRRDLFVTQAVANEQPFRVFGDSLPAVLGQLRFSGGLSTLQLTAGAAPAESVLASYSDGTAAMVWAQHDSAALAIINADLAASNIWKTGSFLPIIDELVQRLLTADTVEAVFHPGESLVARISSAAAADSMKILREGSENAEEVLGQLTDDGAGTLWQWTSPSVPGIYRLEAGGATQFVAAIVLPSTEADLNSLPAEVVRERLAAGREVHFRSRVGAGQREPDLWKWFVVGAVLCLFAEIGALVAFRT